MSSLPLDSKQLYLGLSTDKSEYKSLDNSDGIDPGISIGPNTGTPKTVSFYVRTKTGGMSKKVESGLVDLTFTIGYESTESENKLSMTGREAVEAGFLPHILKDGTYSIDVDASLLSGDILIPRSIDGIAVTEIKDFSYCENITSVIVPDSVTKIAPTTFTNCTSLTNIEIPNSVTEIGQEAFFGCTSLTKLQLPESITKIEPSLFSTVTEIGEDTFNGCSNLTSINIDPNNPNFLSMDGVLFDKDMKTLIRYPEGKTESSYTIPVEANGDYVTGGVETIKGNAFSGNKYLIEINIPSRVMTIENYAFSYCDNLLKINIDNFQDVISTSSYQPWGAKNATVNWLESPAPDIDLEIPLA